jgi:hypothetical protein
MKSGLENRCNRWFYEYEIPLLHRYFCIDDQIKYVSSIDDVYPKWDQVAGLHFAITRKYLLGQTAIFSEDLSEIDIIIEKRNQLLNDDIQLLTAILEGKLNITNPLEIEAQCQILGLNYKCYTRLKSTDITTQTLHNLIQHYHDVTHFDLKEPSQA